MSLVVLPPKQQSSSVRRKAGRECVIGALKRLQAVYRINETFGGATSICGLTRNPNALGCVRDELSIRRPHRKTIEHGVECEPAHRPTHRVPDPDIVLLVSNVEGELCPVWRDARIYVRAIRSPGRLLHAASIDPDEAPLIQRIPLRSVDNRAVVGYVEYPPTYDIPEGGRLADDGGAPYLELRRPHYSAASKDEKPLRGYARIFTFEQDACFPRVETQRRNLCWFVWCCDVEEQCTATWKEMRPRVYLSDRSCHRLCSTACVGDTHEAGRI